LRSIADEISNALLQGMGGNEDIFDIIYDDGTILIIAQGRYENRGPKLTLGRCS
jgi:hypothetical protein